MLVFYGHPFSSYTWKALIALYEKGIDFDYRILEPDQPQHGADEILAACRMHPGRPQDDMRRVRLGYRLQDPSFGDAAEEAVHGRAPASRCHVEIDSLCHPIGMSERARSAIPAFMHGVDRQADDMGEQG